MDWLKGRAVAVQDTLADKAIEKMGLVQELSRLQAQGPQKCGEDSKVEEISEGQSRLPPPGFGDVRDKL